MVSELWFKALKLGSWEPSLWASISRMIEEVTINMEGRGRESQPPHQSNRKEQGSSKVHSNDFATLSVKVSTLEEAMLEMPNRVKKVESDFSTFQTCTLD